MTTLKEFLALDFAVKCGKVLQILSRA